MLEDREMWTVAAQIVCGIVFSLIIAATPILLIW